VLKLEVILGPHRGKTFKCESGGLTIGRDPGNDIALTRDKRVSRLHAEITPWLDGFRLKDMNSNNGTKVRRGQRMFRLGVVKSDCTIEPGDRLAVGDSELAVIEAARHVTLVGDGKSDDLDLSVSKTEIDDLSFIGERDTAATEPEHIADPAAALGLVAEECLADFDAATVVTILLCKPHSTEIERAIERTRDPDRRGSHGISVSRTVFSKTIEEGTPHLIAAPSIAADVDSDDSFVRTGIKSGICLPLAVGGETFGFLQIASRTQENAFTNRDVRAAQLIARRAALNVSRLRLMQQVMESMYRRAMEESVEAVVHDLKSPLNIVNCYVQDVRDALTEGECSTSVAGRLEKIELEIGGMRRLLEDLLHPTGTVHLTFAPTDVAEVVTSLVENFQGHRGHPQMEIVTDIEPGVPVVTADTAALRRVIENLMRNARKAMATSDEPVCTVRVSGTKRILGGKRRDCVTVRITDSGCGIPEPLREKIFDPFMSNMASTGIGLSVARGIVERHGGELVLERTEEGKGSTFAVHIPCER